MWRARMRWIRSTDQSEGPRLAAASDLHKWKLRSQRQAPVDGYNPWLVFEETDTHAVADNHRRKPAEALVAFAAQSALGAMAARRRAARRRQARCGATCGDRPGTRGHRHRERRGTDAAALRDNLH